MREQNIEGWIFDCYPEPEGMRVWVIGRDGAAHDFLDAWSPRLYVSGTPETLPFLKSRPYPMRTRWTRRLELFSGKALPVLEIRIPPPAYAKLGHQLRERGFCVYDAGLDLAQSYHYERGHFPLARCAFEVRGGRLAAWELRDDPWALDYELPPLRLAHLKLSGMEAAGMVDPNHRPQGTLVLSFEGTSHELEGTAEDQLESLSRRLGQWDPDVIATDWGDSFLLPRLTRLAEETGRPLPLSRDPARVPNGRRDRSYQSFGRMIYQAGPRSLVGRWHLDLQNSFFLRETGLEGLFEIARVAQIPVQRAARSTIGTCLSSMQMSWATRNGVLIPTDKQQAEDFRPAEDLLFADKGGLVYEPDVGWHEDVVEYDFASMYPTMMVDHNISPETVNCPCCPDNKVPGVGHHLCRRRRGLVPSVLAPVLEKRARYKALAKEGGAQADAYKRRASAYKWMMVCCFGYLGFKNARFGKIEAHECVTAWGREVLLRAKEAAEGRGARLLHALVDSLWLKLAPGTDIEELRRAIEREAGCPLALEGIYKWLRFCASKQDALSGVPGRYFGAFDNGELKIRGLACRRRDTPKLLKTMQQELLARMAKTSDPRTIKTELLDIVEDYRLRIKEGRVTAEELAISFNLSKTPEEYVHDTLSTLSAKQLAASGVKLHAGENVRYVIVAAKDKVKEWRARPLALMEGGLEYDQEKYLQLLDRAAEEILAGLIAAKKPSRRPAKAVPQLELFPA